MKREVQLTLVCLGFLVLLYYPFPLYLRFTQPTSGILMIMLLTFFFPLVVGDISIWYGYRIGIQVFYILGCGALFLPMGWFMNTSVFIFILEYIIAAAIGSILGHLLCRARMSS